MEQEKERERGRTTENKMTDLSHNISIIKLNLNGLNTQLKDGDWKSGFKSMTQLYVAQKKLSLSIIM